MQLFAESRACRCSRRQASNRAEEQARFEAFNADAAVVVAYGLILPKAILEAPRFGCFNIHASLLPRWRGAAPIQRAIMAGDAETGVAIMRIEEGLDTGAGLPRRARSDRPDETAGELHDRAGHAWRRADGEGAWRARERLARLPAAARRGRHLRRQDRAVRDAHRLVAAGGRGAVSNPRSFAPSRRLVRDRARRQARARQGAPRDARRWRGQARHAARRASSPLLAARARCASREVQRAGKRPMARGRLPARRGAHAPARVLD